MDWKIEPREYHIQNDVAPYRFKKNRHKSSGVHTAARTGPCAICAKRTPQPLLEDHCPDCGEPRGLICRGCNIALGYAGDRADEIRRRIAVLQAQLRYVEGTQKS